MLDWDEYFGIFLLLFFTFVDIPKIYRYFTRSKPDELPRDFINYQ